VTEGSWSHAANASGLPDYPFDWNPVGYWDHGAGGPGEYIIVANPPTLSEETIRPKEQALIELMRFEKARGRKSGFTCSSPTSMMSRAARQAAQAPGFEVEISVRASFGTA